MWKVRRSIQAVLTGIFVVCGLAIAQSVSAGTAGATTTAALSPNATYHACNTTNSGAFEVCNWLITTYVHAEGLGNGSLCALGAVHVELYNETTGAAYNSGTDSTWCGTNLNTPSVYYNHQTWEGILWQYYSGGYHEIVSVVYP